MKNTELFIQAAKTAILDETQAIASLAGRIDNTFASACEIILNCTGRVIVLGIGKSGHISRKIAATFASTGTPAFFVHPSEANHGDSGMITSSDVVLAISYSGESAEILSLLPFLKRLQIPLISITGNPHSRLATQADIHCNVRVDKEACPLGLAPTSSTTATLVLGDALAIALLTARGFTKEDFALSHPGGSLGKRLLLKINDIMRQGNAIPKVTEETSLRDALVEISQKGLGLTAVINQKNELTGVFTDGDLRRTLDQTHDIHKTPIHKLMTKECKRIAPQDLAFEALQVMEEHRITALMVVDNNQLVGVLHMHDLLSAGLV